MLVRKLRIDKGWSQETLAEISGLSVRTVQRIERGGNASLESLGALASAFEVDISTLEQRRQTCINNKSLNRMSRKPLSSPEVVLDFGSY